MGPSSQTEGVRYGQERLSWVRWAGTHSALEGIDLAGVGLDLVSVLHHLLLGLAQCVIILVGGLGQVRHLKAERGPEMMQAEVGKGAWRPWLTLLPVDGATESNSKPGIEGEGGARPPTFDLYHSSASEMFLAAMVSY